MSGPAEENWDVEEDGYGKSTSTAWADCTKNDQQNTVSYAPKRSSDYNSKNSGRGTRGGRSRDTGDSGNSSSYDNRNGPPKDRYKKLEQNQGDGAWRGRTEHDRSDRNRGGGDRVRYNSNSDQITETIEIESNQAGAVIGRAGANIKDVQTEFTVHINVDKNPNANGMVTVSISGDSQSKIEKAIAHIKEKLENSNQRYGQGQGYSRGNNFSTGDDNHGKSSYNSGNSDTRDNDSEKKSDFFSTNTKGGYGKYRRSPSPAEENSGPIDWLALNKQAEEARKIKWAQCPALIKNFYEEAPEVKDCSAEAVAEIREANNKVSVGRLFEDNKTESAPIPNPVWKFEQCFGKYPDLLNEILKQGFETPSPIQCQAWPVLLNGEDLIGIAQTGTGKTLAFLLPAMIHTEYQPNPRSERGGPNVLILAPTRELALQIEKEVAKYSFRGMKAVCVYGGGDRREQINIVGRGVEIIIATPGRLNDLVQAKVVNVNSITYLVLDEADRMLDMGFEPQIRKILLDIRPDRQTIMTSATWPPGVRRLAQSYMNNPIQVCVGTLDLAAVHTVRQVVEIVDEEEKYTRILQFINSMNETDKAIIFCGKKARVDDLSSELTIQGYIVQCIHGSRDQSDREQAIADISSGDVKILIATDVASRGLDIEDITYVVNYDFPRNIEEYVHRVGRTGRAGRQGVSISYITRNDWASASELIHILEEADQEVPEELRIMSDRFAAMKERKANELAAFGGKSDRKYGGGGNRRRGGGPPQIRY